MAAVGITTYANQVVMWLPVLGMFTGCFSRCGGLDYGRGLGCHHAVQFITLPVEFDASRRAKQVLGRLNLITPGAEAVAVSQVLKARPGPMWPHSSPRWFIFCGTYCAGGGASARLTGEVRNQSLKQDTHAQFMKITLQHHNLRSIDELDTIVEEQIISFQPRLRIDEARVRLECRFDESPAFRVGIHLITPGPDVMAEGRDHTLRAAIHKAMSELEAKIGDRHAKRRGARGHREQAAPLRLGTSER